MRRPPAQTADGPLRFSSAFESGNLLCAKLVCQPSCKGGGSSSSTANPKEQAEGPLELEYELYVDNDTQSSAGHTQWFYFGVSTQDFQGTVHFRIVNMRKKRSLYQNGLQPHVYSVRRNRGWEAFACQCVSYVPNANNARARSSTDGGRPDQNTLSFSYRIEHPHDEVYFAAFPPYTYSMLSGFLNRMERHHMARQHFRCSELCRSIGQLPVPLLVISQEIHKDKSRESRDGVRMQATKQEPRLAVAVIARQHPGEVVGSWMAQGLIKFLLGPTPAAKRLRETYVFHVVPMVNVDGVVHGNSRCTLAGVDPNRVWNDPNPIIHPVIYALKNHLRNMANGACTVSGSACKGLDLFLDLHGHSAKFGCFFYGSCPTAPISNALFPKLCSVASQDISFEQCHWRCTRSHRKTARYVMYKQLGVKYSYTLECSFFGPCSISSEVLSSRGERAARACFTPGRVEWIGSAVGRAAATFLGVDCDCRSDPVNFAEPFTSPLEDEPGEADAFAVEAVPTSATASTATGDSSATEEVTWVDQKLQKSEIEIAKLRQENAQLEQSRSMAGGRLMHGTNCTCSDTDLLPDLSCPKVLSRRPWLTIKMLENTTVSEVLDGLIAVYGDHVPDINRNTRGDGSDDGGDSDGDEGPEPEFPDSDNAAAGVAGVTSSKETCSKEAPITHASTVPAGSGRGKENTSGSHQRPPRKPPGREGSQSLGRSSTHRQTSQNAGVAVSERAGGSSSSSSVPSSFAREGPGNSSRSTGVETAAATHRANATSSNSSAGGTSSALSEGRSGADNSGCKSERGTSSAGGQGGTLGIRRESPSARGAAGGRRMRADARASASTAAADRAPSVEHRSGTPPDAYCATPQPGASGPNQRLACAPPWTNWKLEKGSSSGRNSAYLWMDDSSQPDRSLAVGPGSSTADNRAVTASPATAASSARPPSATGSIASGTGGATTVSGASTPVQVTTPLMSTKSVAQDPSSGSSPHRRPTPGPSPTPPPMCGNAFQARGSGGQARAPSVDGALLTLAHAPVQGNMSPQPSQAVQPHLSFTGQVQMRGPSPTPRALGGTRDAHASSAGNVGDLASHISAAWQVRGPSAAGNRGSARQHTGSDPGPTLPRGGRDSTRGRGDSKLHNGSNTERGERPPRNSPTLMDTRLRNSPPLGMAGVADVDERPVHAPELIQTRALVSSRKGAHGIDQGLTIGGGIMPVNVTRGDQYPGAVTHLKSLTSDSGIQSKRTQDRRREPPGPPAPSTGVASGSDARRGIRRRDSN